MRLPIDTESANFENEKTTQLARTIEIDDASLLVSVEQAASILGIGRTRAFKFVMGRTIASVKIGRRGLVVRRSLEEFIQRLVAPQESSDDDRMSVRLLAPLDVIPCAAASLIHATARQVTLAIDHGINLRGEFVMRINAHDAALGGSFVAWCGSDAGTSIRATPM
jgi:hypothetical protein